MEDLYTFGLFFMLKVSKNKVFLEICCIITTKLGAISLVFFTSNYLYNAMVTN